MHETKETNSYQTTTIHERTCQHRRKQYTWCIVFGESVVQSSIENDFRSRSSVVRLKKNLRCEFTQCSYKMNDRKLTFDTALF